MKKKISKITLISTVILLVAVVAISIFMLKGGFIKDEPKAINEDVTLGNITAEGQLATYTQQDDRPTRHFQYTVTNKIEVETKKTVSKAYLDRITITNGQFRTAKEIVIVPNHTPLSTDIQFQDNNLATLEEISAIKNAGNRIEIPVNIQGMQRYHDQVGNKGKSTYSFRIKYYDFQKTNSTEMDFSKLIAAGGLLPRDFNTSIQYTLVLEFSDGQKYSKHIQINIPGTRIKSSGKTGEIFL